MDDNVVKLILDKIDTVHKCLDEHVQSSSDWRVKIEGRLTAQDERLELIEAEAKTAASTLHTVESAVTTAKTMKTVISWVSAIAIGIATIWYATKSLINGESPL